MFASKDFSLIIRDICYNKAAEVAVKSIQSLLVDKLRKIVEVAQSFLRSCLNFLLNDSQMEKVRESQETMVTDQLTSSLIHEEIESLLLKFEEGLHSAFFKELNLAKAELRRSIHNSWTKEEEEFLEKSAPRLPSLFDRE